MHLVRRDVDEGVLLRRRIAGEHDAELLRLARDQLVSRVAVRLAVGDAPEAVVGDARRHVPVVWVDDEVGVFVAVLGEVIVGLYESR